MYYVTVKQYINRDKLEEVSRDEFTGEVSAYGRFAAYVSIYTEKSFINVSPVSITMFDDSKTTFASFQIR